MSAPGMQFDDDAMSAVRGKFTQAAVGLGEHAATMPDAPDAGLSSNIVAGAMSAVADTMQHLTAELGRITVNVTNQGSEYERSDRMTRESLLLPDGN